MPRVNFLALNWLALQWHIALCPSPLCSYTATKYERLARHGDAPGKNTLELRYTANVVVYPGLAEPALSECIVFIHVLPLCQQTTGNLTRGLLDYGDNRSTVLPLSNLLHVPESFSRNSARVGGVGEGAWFSAVFVLFTHSRQHICLATWYVQLRKES